MPAKAIVEPHYIKLKDAARYLGVSPQAISRYVNHGWKGVKLGILMVGGAKRTTVHLCDLFSKHCKEIENQ